MVTTPRRSTTKARAHLTPPRTPKQLLAEVTPLKELRGKGFLDVKANALIKEVLSNRALYPTDVTAAKRLDVSKVGALARPQPMKRISAKRNSVAAGMAGKCGGFVGSFARRLRLCVKLKGAHTGY